MFFTCETEGCKRVTFQNAMELDFICMVCESRLESFDNSKIISVLEKKVDQLNEILQ
jgi:transcription initiation factor IIE alpha subunit